MKTAQIVILIVAILAFTGSNSLFGQNEQRNTAAESLQTSESQTSSTPEVKPANDNEQLLKAYQKEFAFLENERAALNRRIAEIVADNKRNLISMENDIATLQNQLVAISSRIDVKTTEMRNKESLSEDLGEITDILDSTIDQALMSLEKYDVTVPAFQSEGKEKKQEQIDFIFRQGTTLLKELGSVRTKKDSFFLNDGTKVDGTVVWIGNIASLGVSEKGSGTLAPAGGGLFKIWPSNSADAAEALAKGEQPRTLPLYLFESSTKAVSERHDKTFSEIVEAGGVIAYVIVILGIIGGVMLVARIFFLWNSSTDIGKLVDEVIPFVQKGEVKKALDICHPSKGAASRVLAATIRNTKTDPEHLEDIISESILHETPYLDRFESAIMVFAAVAPLLGLLGTVTGMISTFDIITEYGTGDPKLLSGGISEALITTQLGLMVAIPMLLLGNLLSGWSDKIKDGMESAALRVMNITRGSKEEISVEKVTV